MTAADFWAQSLREWAIPQPIQDAAPVPPWGFPPDLFRWRPAPATAATAITTPSGRRALEALPDGGSVLDVGVGGGRASLPLAPPARLVVGVDQSEELLASFDEAASAAGVEHRLVHGGWPQVAAAVEPADVVVCHHVLYNVADAVPFVAALTDHARRRVVVEITRQHPTSNLTPAWLALHGLVRPTRPTADDAIALLREMGLPVESETFEREGEPRERAQVVAFARRRLCVGAERDAEIDALLGPEFEFPNRQVVTLWWDT